ncbi:immunoglobulin domain-containing protein [Echinicola sediminis]
MVVADQVTEHSHVLTPSNASEDNDQFATVESYGGAALGIGRYSGALELKFNEFPLGETTVPTGTRVYVKMGGADDILNTLLGGALGETLADLLGTVVLGNHYFEIDLKLGNSVVMSKNSKDSMIDDEFRILQGRDGDFYIALTAPSEFDRVTITDRTDALLLGASNSINVYHAFYYDGACSFFPEYVSYDASGIGLDVLDLGNASVSDPGNAIDGNYATSSTISPGLLSVLGSVSQYFHFSGPSAEGDQLNVVLSGDPSLLNLELLNNVYFLAYNGDLMVYEQDLGSLSDELLGLIGLDVLGLLTDGEQVSFPVSPGEAFDRFEIKVNSLLDVDIGQAINIHEVERTLGKPSFDIEGNTMPICKGTEVVLEPSSYYGSRVKWYDAPVGGNLVYSGESFDLGMVDESVTYYVASTDECNGNGIESERVALSVEAVPMPNVTDFQAEPEQVEYGEGEKVVLLPNIREDSELNDPQFVWSFNTSGEPVISNSTIDKGSHTVNYRVRPDGALEIEGLLPEEEIDDVYLFLSEGENGCKTGELVDQIFRVLPIGWRFFEGQEYPFGNKLKWSPSSSQSISRFEVERASVELNWKKLEEVGGGEAGGEVFDYEYVDRNPDNGANYYRIKAFLENGKMEVSEIVRIVNSGNRRTDSFTISPNPVLTRPKIHNESGNSFQNLEVYVLNSGGEEVYRTQLKNLEAWSNALLDEHPMLNPGIYVYCVRTPYSISRIKVLW